MPRAARSADAYGGPPRRVVLVAVLAALALHGLVLSGLPARLTAPNDKDAGGLQATLRVRSMATAAYPVSGPATTETPAFVPPESSAHPVAERLPIEVAGRLSGSPSRSPPVPMSVPVHPSEPTSPDLAAGAASATAASMTESRDSAASLEPSTVATANPPRSAAAVPETVEDIPVYATSFAPSQELIFHLKRGVFSGVGTLVWRLDSPPGAGARYEMQLDAKVAGTRLMSQHSQGHVDAAGLAPQRFTDQRLKGSMRAANFQRERGVISFSGSSAEFPLPAGVQDRLSWMVQLPAILAADPRLAGPEQQINLYVVGARGDAVLWLFRFVAAELVLTDAGEVPALKFIREPRKAHDTQAEVWLDPAQHHLPVRARIGNPPDGDVLDMVRIGR